MKKTLALFVASALLGAVNPALGQDPVKLSPKFYNVLLENEHVRVLEFRMKAGEKEPMHSHPAVVAYAFTENYKVRWTTPDGKSGEREPKAGTAVWGDPVTHTWENLGPADAHVLIIEMKDLTAGKKVPEKKEMEK